MGWHMNKIFYIFRHGQTDFNAAKRMQGWLDVPLNNDGIIQAQNLAKNLAKIEIDCIFTSPLSRALNTAQIVSGDRHIKITPVPGLKEWNLGVFCGKIVHVTDEPADTPINTDSDVVNVPLALISDDNYRPQGGESYNMFAKRVCDTMTEIANTTNSENIAISTHGGVIKVLIKKFTNLKWPRSGIPNAEHIKMQWDGKKFILPEPPDWLLFEQKTSLR